MDLQNWATGIVDTTPALTPTLTGRLRDSFHTARGYREVAVEYTAIPDAAYPWDPLVMRKIKQLRPDAVPLWVRWVFRTPQDEENPHDVVYGRHALGLVGRGEPQEGFRVMMPTINAPQRPTSLWFIHEGSVDPQHRELPGSYLPFDGTIIDRVARTVEAVKMSDKEYKEALRKELLEDKFDAWQKRKARLAAERAERDADFMDYAYRQFDAMNVDDKNRLFGSH